MARRGENIHKRKDGRWEGRYIKGRSETGKAIWGYVYAYSYVDAKSALIRKKVKAADYTVPLGAQELTISVLSELWLSTLNDLEDSSIAHYRYSIEHYIFAGHREPTNFTAFPCKIGIMRFADYFSGWWRA